MCKGVAASLIPELSDLWSALSQYCFEVIANFKTNPNPVFDKKPKGATDEDSTLMPQIKTI